MSRICQNFSFGFVQIESFTNMDAPATKKRRALTDVSNKGSNAGAKKKCLGPAVFAHKVNFKASKKAAITRKSSIATKKTSSVDKLLPPIERLTVSQEEQEVVTKGNENKKVAEEGRIIEVKEVERALNWINVDADTTCTYFLPEYVTDIFQYYRDREPLFRVRDYMMSSRTEVSIDMRAVLVDWLVDVQQSFELNHESLYSAVKMFDLYLSRTRVSKSKIQLVGAVALNISCKYDERIPPVLDDFVYVCDDAYNRNEFIEMEKSILQVLNFDIGFPLSYTFLRRFSQCGRMSTLTLTLARFILEMSLMYYEFVKESESVMACAALFLAMAMRAEGTWDDTLVHYTGYVPAQFGDVVLSLNGLLGTPTPFTEAKSIRSKYSHKVFHEVAKTALLSSQQLLEILGRQ